MIGSAEPQRGFACPAGAPYPRRRLPRPAAGQEGRHQGFYPLNSHFLLGGSGADCRHVTASKMGNGSRVTLAFVSQHIRSSQIHYCYTYRLLHAGRDITVSRNSLTRCTARHLRFRRLVQFIFAGPVSNNALKNCAALLCRTCADSPICVAVRYLTLRTGFERHGRKNPLSYPYFRSGRRSLVCVRLSNKGKVGVQRGRETAGVPSFLPPRRVPRRSRRPQTANPPAEVQRKTPRPERANPLAQFASPAQPVLKKLPPG